MIRPFTPAWLAGSLEASEFLPRHFTDPAARKAAVEAAHRQLEPAVLAALRSQNPAEASAKGLAALANGQAVVAVTGQQTGLFLGPLYVLHKAATAIRVARALEAETGRVVVPIFWLQTEDADFEEIRATHIPDGSLDGLTLSLQDALEAGTDGHRVPIAHRPLGASIADCLAAAERAIGDERHGEETIALLRRHYRADATIADAFAGVLGELFADEGLLVFNPRDPQIASLTGRFFTHALEATPALDVALLERAAALETAGFKVQVPVRRGATLICYQPEASDGPRYRLCTEGDDFLLAGRPEARLARDVVWAALQTDPQRFSTTALLRPAFQDFLLPTAAYIGGPGEIAYYAEMGPVYEALAMQAPLIIPRARLRLVTASVQRVAAHLGVDLASPLDADALRARLTPCEDASLSGLHAEALAAVDAYLEGLAAATPALESQDVGLKKATVRSQREIQRQLDRLNDRFGRARLRGDTMLQQRLCRLIGELAPGGAPQERVVNFAYFAAHFGVAKVASGIVAAATPYEHQVKDVNL